MERDGPWIECLACHPKLGVNGLSAGKLYLNTRKPLVVGRSSRCEIQVLCSSEVGFEGHAIALFSLDDKGLVSVEHGGGEHSIQVVQDGSAEAPDKPASVLIDGPGGAGKANLCDEDLIELVTKDGALALRLRVHIPSDVSVNSSLRRLFRRFKRGR